MSAAKRVSRVVPLRTKLDVPRGPVVGRLVGLSERAPLIDYRGNTRGPVEARLSVRIERTELEAAVVQQREVVLAFEGERAELPLITGFIERMPQAEPQLDVPRQVPVEARVDGKRVVIDAEDEIVLRCGKASITLRRNGRVVVRGTYVETASEGVHRIKGGSVLIN
jgi:hypothetical protein